MKILKITPFVSAVIILLGLTSKSAVSYCSNILVGNNSGITDSCNREKLNWNPERDCVFPKINGGYTNLTWVAPESLGYVKFYKVGTSENRICRIDKYNYFKRLLCKNPFGSAATKVVISSESLQPGGLELVSISCDGNCRVRLNKAVCPELLELSSKVLNN